MRLSRRVALTMTTKDCSVRRQRGAPVIEHAYNQVRSFNELKENAHSLHRIAYHEKTTVRIPNDELRPSPSGPEGTTESVACLCEASGTVVLSPRKPQYEGGGKVCLNGQDWFVSWPSNYWRMTSG